MKVIMAPNLVCPKCLASLIVYWDKSYDDGFIVKHERPILPSGCAVCEDAGKTFRIDKNSYPTVDVEEL
jgi:hypothetical protein